MLVDAEDIASGVAEVCSDLGGFGVDGLDDLAAVSSDEIDGGGGAVDHDVDDDAGFGEMGDRRGPTCR